MTDLVANLSAGVALVLAKDGEIVYTNNRWDSMFGYARGELLGRHISVVNAATDQTPQDRAHEIMDALERYGTWSGEVRNSRKDGSDFWAACNVSRFDHPDHGVVWLSVNTDITARHAAEQELRRSEESYRRLFESSPAALALVEPDLRLSLVNREFARILGYTPEQLQGRALPDLTHPDDVARCAELREQVLAGDNGHYGLIERLISSQGRSVRVALSATVIRGDNGGPAAEIAMIERLEET
jgi:PAS domain S-box-containing protein